MQHNITNMVVCPLTRCLRVVATAFCTIGFILWPSSSFARDASVLYRNSPGFQCHRWNDAGECADWSTFNYGYTLRSTPVYRGNALYWRDTSLIPVRPSTMMRCNNSRVDCTGHVTVRVRAMPNPVLLGNLLTYTLYVRNADSQVRTVNVRAYLDENVDLDSATYGGFADGNLVRWDGLKIPAWSSRSFTMRVRVRSHTSFGTPIALTVQAGSSVDRTSVAVLDAGYYRSAIRVLDDGVFVYENRYGTRAFPWQPIFYRDPFWTVRRKVR